MSQEPTLELSAGGKMNRVPEAKQSLTLWSGTGGRAREATELDREAYEKHVEGGWVCQVKNRASETREDKN